MTEGTPRGDAGATGKETMMMRLKGCQRCHGDQMVTVDEDGATAVCLQCGQDVELERTLRRATTYLRRPSATPERETSRVA